MTRLLFFILFCSNASASMFLNKVLNKNNQNLQKSCCYQSPVNPTKEISHSKANLGVNCEVTCVDGSKKSATTEFLFSTEAEYLERGDGYQPNFKVYSFFLTQLIQKSKLACLETAAQTCQQLSKVKEAKTISLKSSYWKKDFLIAEFCPADAAESDQYADSEIFPVPYDVTSSEKNFTPKAHDYSDLLPGYKNINYANVANGYPEDLEKIKCKNWIEGTVCYGDCQPEKVSNAVLFSQKQGNIGNMPQNVCADEFINAISKEKISTAVKVLYCEDFFFKTLYYKRAQGITCSAFRGRTNCASLFH